MTIKTEEIQDQTKRLRFKSPSNNNQQNPDLKTDEYFCRSLDTKLKVDDKRKGKKLEYNVRCTRLLD